jgi:hypothetical protein
MLARLFFGRRIAAQCDDPCRFSFFLSPAGHLARPFDIAPLSQRNSNPLRS